MRFLHTADLQLGMPFHKVPGDKGARLRQYRFDTIRVLAELAEDRGAGFVLIAGDLFDANTLDDSVVAQACHLFGEARVPFYVIPGNHDHLGADSIFRRESFARARPDNLHVLGDTRPIHLAEHDVVLLPAPLIHRHEDRDPTAHIVNELGRDLPGVTQGTLRVGLAHGAMRDFRPGYRVACIAAERVLRAGLDYLALGDWHGTKRVDARTWYSGAPEPTSFKANDQGNVLCVTIESHDRPPDVETIPTARSCWLLHTADLRSPGDVDELERWFDAIEKPLETLVRLELTGVLNVTDLERLESVLTRNEDRLLHLRRFAEDIVAEASDAELDAIAVDGYVKAAVERLRTHAAAGGESAKHARSALRLLWLLKHRPGTEEPGAC